MIENMDDPKGAINSVASSPAWAGLFWFSGDFLKVSPVVCSFREITDSDFIEKNSIVPVGEHRDFMQHPSDIPRGRVSLINGEVKINVGFDCPDEAVEKVIKCFNLEKFRHCKGFRVVRGYHWNRK